MRPFLLLLLLTLLGPLAHAQDLLTKRNGEEISVKVVEITPSEVRYRRADNPNGPLITIWKSDVFQIRYANGSLEMAPPPAPAPAVVPAPTPAYAPALPAPARPAASASNVPVISNTDPNDAVLGETIHLDGPRLGFTVLSARVIDKARENHVSLGPVISQFGWQFESRLFRLANGVSGLVEFVPLIGGLDQGQFLPSVSGLLGVRGPKGFEFGVGPNVTLLGPSLVLAMGTSIQSNGINFPINVAVAPSSEGARISLLVGFNARHR
ncbi:hypothetical protein MON38_11145 [Hymenobacter sp. DH14]|uniref:Uncharacterized protein n=1 Tax=Hymenobacter cyanobacteriorum TaxID=2926463 RepID=A0A9X1VFU4_9BACT|nr:hypothetical protein [Hymenobacter cyanobacteriorum]MCI1187977.1 hypothetical protein [Hymenobacter cyanobacteriorum]